MKQFLAVRGTLLHVQVVPCCSHTNSDISYHSFPYEQNFPSEVMLRGFQSLSRKFVLVITTDSRLFWKFPPLTNSRKYRPIYFRLMIRNNGSSNNGKRNKELWHVPLIGSICLLRSTNEAPTLSSEAWRHRISRRMRTPMCACNMTMSNGTRDGSIHLACIFSSWIDPWMLVNSQTCLDT